MAFLMLIGMLLAAFYAVTLNDDGKENEKWTDLLIIYWLRYET